MFYQKHPRNMFHVQVRTRSTRMYTILKLIVDKVGLHVQFKYACRIYFGLRKIQNYSIIIILYNFTILLLYVPTSNASTFRYCSKKPIENHGYNLYCYYISVS